MQKDIFIQARMSSTRMPGKVLFDIQNIPILVRTINRIRRCKIADNIVVITSTNEKDGEIEKICNKFSIPIYRGSESDLLDRHYKAASYFGSDYVFKIPSDCPFTDSEIITKVLKIADKYEYVSNYHPPTFPDGLDVEGARFDILEEAWKFATKPHEREHTFPYIWDNPSKFKMKNFNNKRGNMFMTHRWTLDYPEDLIFIKAVYKEFNYKEYFSFEEILNLLKKKPELSKLNSMHNGINWYRNEASNLKTIDSSQYKIESKHKNET
ncbi:cytidylyltransferase domain-containing protein [Candidatus Pelagibacter sp. HIMB1521]|uniref:cytidylyltransferase domain-containing protein n=1 Tax=Candidatus Pelagibacter sp. HIMB1521 TaxID=3413344 RepID=UPI003F855448